jgi:RIO-like serine/threonine protein kinase
MLRPQRWPRLTWTAVPDALFDELMPHLSDAELRILLLLARETYGWRRESCVLSRREIARRTGLAQSTVQIATASLRRLNLIYRYPSDSPNDVGRWGLTVDGHSADALERRDLHLQMRLDDPDDPSDPSDPS